MRSKFLSQDPFGDDPFDPAGDGINSNFLPASFYLAPGHASASPSTGSPPLILPPLTPILPAESVEAQAAQNGSGGPGSVVAETSSTGFTINLEFDAAAMAAPASFRADIEQAASILSATITNKITVNIGIDYSGTGGGAAAGPDNGAFVNYSTVRADLISNATPGDTTFNALPTGSTIQGQSSVAVWNAQLKLFGLLPANSTTTDDGSATFATDINPNLLVGVALHELTHAMGRVPYGTEPDIFDFYRFTSAGTRLFSDSIPTSAAYFSVDGGNTKLADFGLYSDPSDFLNAGPTQLGAPYSSLTPNDAFDELYGSNTTQGLSAVDKEMLDALGFNTIIYQPPVVTASNVNLASGATVAASSLFSVSDPEGQAITQYALLDNTPGAGHFVVNGVVEPEGQIFYLTPAQLAETTFVAGSGGATSYSMFVNAYDGTAWASYPYWIGFDINVAAYQPPVVTASNVNLASGATVAASSLFSVSDPEGQAITQYGLLDNTPGAGHFVANGVVEPEGQIFYLTPTQLAETTFVAGSGAATSYSIFVNAYDGTSWASYPYWNEFNLNVAAYQPPVITASNVNLASGATIAASSLFSVSDPEGQPITQYALLDNTPGAGHFVVNGVAEPEGQIFYLTPAQLAETTFVAGSGGATSYSIYVNAFDGTAWATYPYWSEFNLNVAAYQPPVVTASNVNVASGATIAASSLFSVSDPEGQAITQYALLDNTPGAGHFVVNGVAEPEGQIFYLTPAQLAETTFVAGSGDATSYSIYVNAYDGTAWATYPYWNEFNLNVAASAAVASGATIATSSDAAIGAHATLEIDAADSASVTFQTSTGTLQIDHSSTFTGVIFNFTGDGSLSGSDQIDLRDINYSTAHDTFTNGVLTVTDGTHTAELDFSGSYVLANFDFASDGNGGTIVYDPPTTSQSPAPTDAADTTIHVTGNSTISGSAGLGSGQVVVDSGATLTLNNVVASAGTITNNGTVDITNNSVVNIAAGTGPDNFVFAPNFGQATLTHFVPGTDSIQIDHTVFASLDALFAAIHDDAHGNAVITDAAHDTITVQNITTAQLLAHQGDFHLV